MGKNNVVFTICKNVHCRKPLTDWEINRQLNQRKPYLSQFCRHCRRWECNGHGSFKMECILCSEDITFNTFGIFCETCRNSQGGLYTKLKGAYPTFTIVG